MQKSVDAREGALSAVECLTYKLGRLALLLCRNSHTHTVSAPVLRCAAVRIKSYFDIVSWLAHRFTAFVKVNSCLYCQASSRCFATSDAEQLSHLLAACAEC